MDVFQKLEEVDILDVRKLNVKINYAYIPISFSFSINIEYNI